MWEKGEKRERKKPENRPDQPPCTPSKYLFPLYFSFIYLLLLLFRVLILLFCLFIFIHQKNRHWRTTLGDKAINFSTLQFQFLLLLLLPLLPLLHSFGSIPFTGVDKVGLHMVSLMRISNCDSFPQTLPASISSARFSPELWRRFSPTIQWQVYFLTLSVLNSWVFGSRVFRFWVSNFSSCFLSIIALFVLIFLSWWLLCYWIFLAHYGSSPFPILLVGKLTYDCFM